MNPLVGRGVGDSDANYGGRAATLQWRRTPADHHLRCGVWVGAGGLRRWQADFVRGLLRQWDACLVAVEESTHTAGRTGIFDWLVRRAQGATALQRVRADELNPGLSIASGPAEGPEVAAREHRLSEADVVVQFGPGAWSGAGRVLAFQFEALDDPFLAAFQVLEAGRSVIRVELVVRGGADGVVVQEALLPVAPTSYRRTLETVLAECAAWAPRLGHKVPRDAPPSSSRIYRRPARAGPAEEPDAAQALTLGARLGANLVRKAGRSLFRHDEWAIGVIAAPISEFLRPRFRPECRWIRFSDRRAFRADPFGMVENGRTGILYEHLDYASDRGSIMALELDDAGGHRDARVVMSGSHHFSYPFLFRHDNQIYCVPETAAARRVTLFRASRFPYDWEPVATLLEGIAALDATVFRHQDRWWLICTDQEKGPRHKLYAWHARELMEPWIPHTANPIKVDIRSGRPGGTPFVHQGRLYRPAQDGSGTYGGRLAINRVTALTPERFEEEVAAVIDPLAGSPYPDGLHTLSALGPNVTLIDAKRLHFNRWEFRRKLTRLARGVLGRR